MRNKKILFIVEKNLLEGKFYLGSSNDLILIFQALQQGLQVYLSTPKNILAQNQLQKFSALKLSENLYQGKIIPKFISIADEIKTAWHHQVINCLLAKPNDADDAEKSRSKILFLDSKIEAINLNEILIFNRAEPISLSNKFYDTLISWQKKGAKILPNPFLNKILGDKLAIYAIHYNQTIAGLNLLDGINFADEKNKISFESKIIWISKNDLTAQKILQFYDLLIAENFAKAEEIFKDEYQIFMQGAKEYLEFHGKLGNDSIIKPANYFGGTGVVVAQNQILNLNQAIKNITKSFLAVWKDCKNSDHLDLAFLPTIIVQERATLAHLGDLRIVFCGNNFQGIFVRVNPNFEKSNANNLHFGGHPESLFKRYRINKEGIDLMIDDMKKSGLDKKSAEIKKAKALYGLLQNLDFLQQIKILSEYPIIGIDALLTEDKNGDYKYKINEINLTSPMGQTQLLLLQMAVQFSDLAVEILQKNGFEIRLEKYQILADYFKNQDEKTALLAQKILLQNQHLQDLITKEAGELLVNNFATKTLKHFIGALALLSG